MVVHVGRVSHHCEHFVYLVPLMLSATKPEVAIAAIAPDVEAAHRIDQAMPSLLYMLPFHVSAIRCPTQQLPAYEATIDFHRFTSAVKALIVENLAAPPRLEPLDNSIIQVRTLVTQEKAHVVHTLVLVPWGKDSSNHITWRFGTTWFRPAHTEPAVVAVSVDVVITEADTATAVCVRSHVAALPSRTKPLSAPHTYKVPIFAGTPLDAAAVRLSTDRLTSGNLR